MKSCNLCDKEFENHAIYANHIRWDHKKIKFSDEAIKNREKSLSKLHEQQRSKYGKFIDENRICLKCGNEFIMHRREKHIDKKPFCSRKCASGLAMLGHHHTAENKLRFSEISKNRWKDEKYVEKMMNIPRFYTSKNEVFIREYFIEKFKNDEWTFGRLANFNEFFLNVDLYSRKLKICFEYDGIWHFKDIHGQLADKQNKDKALEEWCLKNDFRLIRLQDEIFLSDKDGWLNKIIDEIYNGTEKIVKFYK